MDHHQRMIAPHTAGMNGARHQLLSSTTLAGDEHSGVGGGDRLDGVEDPLHGNALADNVRRMCDLRDCLFKPGVLLLGATVGHRLGDQMRDLVRIERFGHVVVGPVL